MKMRLGFLVACLLSAGAWWPDVFTTSPSVAGPVLSGSPLKGRNVFVSKGCVKCHAAWGAGGHIGPDLARLGMGRSLFEIAGALWNHSPRMIAAMQQSGVARPTFSAEEMGDFIAYLYYLNYYNEPGNAAAGRRLFAEKGCRNCHSIQNDGGQTGPALDDHRRYQSALVVAQAMWNHGPQMMASIRASGVTRPDLRGRQAADLLAYVRGQTAGEMPIAKFMPPGSPATGRRLFAEKGCTACHGIDGRGGTAGPDLLRRGAYQSVAEIAGAMWNHGPEIWAKMQRRGVARPIFSGNDMADLVAYLYFLRYTGGPGRAVAGKRLFQIKGCASCHAAGRALQGGLKRAAMLDSPAELMAAMWNHAPTMEQQAQDKRLAWPVFQGEEMCDVVEYIKSLAKSSAKRLRR